jgi:hypothetical protein
MKTPKRSAGADWIGCSLCDGWFHGQCTSLENDVYIEMVGSVGVRSPLINPDHPVLSALFSDLRSACDFLNILSLNIHQSIIPKMTELRTFLVPSLFHLLAFSETWLKSRHANRLVAFDGSNVFRADCSRVACGGVALYVNKSIESTRR